MRTAWFAAILVAIVLPSSTVGVSGASRPDVARQISADVEGHRIRIEDVPDFYCHDFDFPRIRCFRSAATLELAVAERSRAAAPTGVELSLADYVTIFDGPNYTGGYMDVSLNYDVLWSIGWNDRISSYKPRNNASGILWTDWFATGTGRTFCCNSAVSSLPVGQDNAFSSLYRR